MSGLSHHFLPLPVAVLTTQLEGFRHLVSFTALWHVLPNKSSISTTLASHRVALWEKLAISGVIERHLVRSKKSQRHLSFNIHGDPTELAFNMFMGTLLFWFDLSGHFMDNASQFLCKSFLL